MINKNSSQLDRSILEVLYNHNEPIDLRTIAWEGKLANSSIYKAIKRVEHLLVVKRKMEGKWTNTYQMSDRLRSARKYCLDSYSFDILDVICKNSK